MSESHGVKNTPEVHCTYDKLAPTLTLIPSPENPNRHPPEQLALYAKILRHQGWRKPITVSNRSNHIVTGHGAWLTAKSEGWARVPVDYQDFASKADELAHMLADNKLPQMSELNESQVAKIADELSRDASFDLSLAGITVQLKEAASDPIFPITAKLNESYDYVLIFTENSTDFAFLQTLCGVQTEMSYKNTTIGTGRCVPFARFLEFIRENYHSLNVQGAHHDDPSPAPKLRRRRARKSKERL